MVTMKGEKAVQEKVTQEREKPPKKKDAIKYFKLILSILIILNLLLVIFTIFTIFLTKDSNHPCDGNGWVAFDGIKCFKIINKLVTHDEAETRCNQEYDKNSLSMPTLVSIRSASEQEYLTDYAFKHMGAVDNIWIGAKRESNMNHFIWNDGTQMIYTNWIDGSPSQEQDKNCVQMISRFSKELSNTTDDQTNIDGKWKETSCSKRNLILCEKMQKLSAVQFQNQLASLRNDVTNAKNLINDIGNKLNNANLEIEDIRLELNDTRIDLNNALLELNETKFELNYIQLEMIKISNDLKDTKQELIETNNLLDNTINDLDNIQNQLTETNDELQDTKEALTEAILQFNETRDQLFEAIHGLIGGSNGSSNGSSNDFTNIINDLNNAKIIINETRFELNITRIELTDTVLELNVAKNQLQDTRRELDNTITDLTDTKNGLSQATNKLINTQAQLNETNFNLQQLIINPVPIGFIYTQLSGQHAPNVIWPTAGWTDVTQQYAGLFFRAEGGGSAEFGSQQQEQCPRLIEVQSEPRGGYGADHTQVNADGGWTGQVETGSSPSVINRYIHLRFKVSAGEVRPKNTAVRFWKRTN